MHAGWCHSHRWLWLWAMEDRCGCQGNPPQDWDWLQYPTAVCAESVSLSSFWSRRQAGHLQFFWKSFREGVKCVCNNVPKSLHLGSHVSWSFAKPAGIGCTLLKPYMLDILAQSFLNNALLPIIISAPGIGFKFNATRGPPPSPLPNGDGSSNNPGQGLEVDEIWEQGGGDGMAIVDAWPHCRRSLGLLWFFDRALLLHSKVQGAFHLLCHLSFAF